jgi:hypothetical protein
MMMLHFTNEGSDFGEIWTRPHDVDDSYDSSIYLFGNSKSITSRPSA